jgi:hypothetical protein
LSHVERFRRVAEEGQPTCDQPPGVQASDVLTIM